MLLVLVPCLGHDGMPAPTIGLQSLHKARHRPPATQRVAQKVGSIHAVVRVEVGDLDKGELAGGCERLHRSHLGIEGLDV